MVQSFAAQRITPVVSGTRLLAAATIPTGWYQVGWSEEFEAARPVPLRYFGEALVGFRGESGTLHVLDAYCRHMGADLGHGGRVTGDEIICPFHGWQWDGASGLNTCIPYDDGRGRMRIAMGTWPVREIDGVALVWYSPTRQPPSFEPPRFYPRDDEPLPVYPDAATTWRGIEMLPQQAAENAPDIAHFQWVHRNKRLPTLAAFAADGACFAVDYELVFGEGHGPTWATPDGPVDGTIRTAFYGLGLGWNHQAATEDIYTLSAYTPVDAQTTDLRMTVWTSKRRRDGAPFELDQRTRWFNFFKGQMEADMEIWVNQTYIEKAPFARLESQAMRAMRDWSRQFYEEAPLED